MTQIIVTLCYYCRYLGVTLEKRDQTPKEELVHRFRKGTSIIVRHHYFVVVKDHTLPTSTQSSDMGCSHCTMNLMGYFFETSAQSV